MSNNCEKTTRASNSENESSAYNAKKDMPSYIDYSNRIAEEIMEVKDVEKQKMKEEIKADIVKKLENKRLMRYKRIDVRG